jgi:hypothetical protein
MNPLNKSRMEMVERFIEKLPEVLEKYFAIALGDIPAPVAIQAKVIADILDRGGFSVVQDVITYLRNDDYTEIIARAKAAATEAKVYFGPDYLPPMPGIDEDYLTDGVMEFLEVDAIDEFSLELCALAYTHRSHAQLVASGYTAHPQPVKYDPVTLKYSPEVQAKRDHVKALREGRAEYRHATSRDIFAQLARLEETLANAS